MKWLDLSSTGFSLKMRKHVSGKNLFVLVKSGSPTKEVEATLVNKGFKPFPLGYAAPITWGNADFLASLPGVTKIDVAPNDVQTAANKTSSVKAQKPQGPNVQAQKAVQPPVPEGQTNPVDANQNETKPPITEASGATPAQKPLEENAADAGQTQSNSDSKVADTEEKLTEEGAIEEDKAEEAIRISRLVAQMGDEELKALRQYNQGSAENMNQPLWVKFVLKDKADHFYYKLNQIESIADKYKFILKHLTSLGALNACQQVGRGSFAEKVDLNSAIKGGSKFEQVELSPRRGYVQATFTIDLKPSKTIVDQQEESHEQEPGQETETMLTAAEPADESETPSTDSTVEPVPGIATDQTSQSERNKVIRKLIAGLENKTIGAGDLDRQQDGRFTVISFTGVRVAYMEGTWGREELIHALKGNLSEDSDTPHEQQNEDSPEPKQEEEQESQAVVADFEDRVDWEDDQKIRPVSDIDLHDSSLAAKHLDGLAVFHCANDSDMIITRHFIDKTGSEALGDTTISQGIVKEANVHNMFMASLGNRVKVDPVGLYRHDGDDNTIVALFNPETVTGEYVSPVYIRHFLSKYPNVEFYADVNNPGKSTVVVFSEGVRVGIVMPMTYPQGAPTLNEFEAALKGFQTEATGEQQDTVSDEDDDSHRPTEPTEESDVEQNLKVLKAFVPQNQLAVFQDLLTGEEGEYFEDLIATYANRFKTMAKTYDQDGQGDLATCYLHYFSGGSDWYITERDMEEEQIQAYGFSILNGDTENTKVGYINIEELCSIPSVELDLHFDPTRLRSVKEKHGIAPTPTTYEQQANEVRASVSWEQQQEVIAQYPPTEEVGLRKDWRENDYLYIKGKLTKKKVEKQLESAQDSLQRDIEIYEDLRTNGIKNLSDYDVMISSGQNPLLALNTALSLKTAHISFQNSSILQAKAFLDGKDLDAIDEQGNGLAAPAEEQEKTSGEKPESPAAPTLAAPVEEQVNASVAQSKDTSPAQTSESEQHETQNEPELDSALSMPFAEEAVCRNPNHYPLTDEINRAGQGFNPSERIVENIEAIRLLKELEGGEAGATDEQKQILARYNGFGGLDKVFGYSHEMYGAPQWARDAQTELLELVGGESIYDVAKNDEWNSAKGSILNAHFTDLDVCRAIWGGIEASWPADNGTMLEPAMGSGNFLGTAPQSIIDGYKIYGVEKDLLTGRIAQQIYPDAKIKVSGFEETAFPNNHFDIAVTNVPFGNYKVFDKRYPELKNHSIHNYFIIKTLEKTKPDGVCAFVTSSYTMNSKNMIARREMAKRGELIGAVRLPSTSQKGQAGVEVVTDVLFFKPYAQPRDLSEEQMPEWVYSEEIDVEQFEPGAEYPPIMRNKYFTANPDHVLGEQKIQSSQFGFELTVAENDPTWRDTLSDLCAEFGSAVKNAKQEDAGKREKVEATATIRTSIEDVDDDFFDRAGGEALPGLIIEREGKFFQVNYELDNIADFPLPNKKAEKRLSGLLAVREALLDLLSKGNEQFSETDRQKSRIELNKIYDDFVKRYGCINKRVNLRLVQEDPFFGLLSGCEHYDPETDEAEKADIFYKSLYRDKSEVVQAETVPEALAASLRQFVTVDFSYMAELLNRDVESVREEAVDTELVYYNPASNKHEIAAQYLSGDVRKKLMEAEDGLEVDPALERNVEALKKVQPEDIPPEEIRLRIGAQWVPVQDVEEYLYHRCSSLTYVERNQVKVDLVSGLGVWTVDVPYGIRSHRGFINEFGTVERPLHKLMERLLNQKSVAVYDTIKHPDGTSTRVLNQEETLQAEEKASLLQADFFDYMLIRDKDRAERLARLYNDTFNCFVSPKYDGSVLEFPDLNPNITPRAHQANAVFRVLIEGNTMFAHEVGTGKTMCQVITAVENKRLGRCQKPVIAVKNNTIEQINREANALYPGKRILLVQKSDLEKKNRKKLMGKIVNNDWDLIVISHSQFKRLPLSKKIQKQYIDEDLFDLRMMMDEQKMKGENAKSEKEIEKALKREEAKLEGRLAALERSQDFGITFDTLKTDMVLYDESHNLKNLSTGRVSTQFSDNISGSDQAYDFYLKSRFIEEELDGTIVFSTGTPVSNNVLELFNIQRYLQRKLLATKGLGDMASWGAAFLAPKTELEPKPGGDGWQTKTRASLINVPELMQSIRHCADIVLADDVADIKRPKVNRKNIVVEQTPIQKKIMEYLNWRVSQLHNKDNSEDNILCIVTDGRKLAADPRLFNDLLPDYPELDSEVKTKATECALQAKRIYDEKNDIKGTQLVFCDMGVYKKGQFNIYDDLRQKMVAQGIPEEEIAFVHEYDSTDAKKKELSAKINSGQLRVLIGNTIKMGEGSNYQERLAAVHHFDPPWRPSDIEQRTGRMERQGNINEDCENLIYTTKDTFDLFMWKTLQRKAEMFGQLFRGEINMREFDLDLNPTYAETAALTSGNELLKAQIETELKVQKLEALKRSFYSGKRNLQWLLSRTQSKLEARRERIQMYAELQDMLGDQDVTFGDLEWTIDLSPFKDQLKKRIKGDRYKVSGDRKKILSAINYLYKEHHIKRVDTLWVEGVPVTCEKVFDTEKDHTVTHFAVSTEQGNRYTWDKPSALEGTLQNLRSISRLKSEEQEICQEYEKTQSDLDKPFEHEEDLAEAIKARTQIALEIQEQESASEDDESFEFPDNFLMDVENFIDVLPASYFEDSIKDLETLLEENSVDEEDTEESILEGSESVQESMFFAAPEP